MTGMLTWQVLLALLAAAFVLYALLRKPRGSAPTAMTSQVAVYRQRVQELEQEREQGIIDDQQFRELEQELERQLLVETPEGDDGIQSGRGAGSGTAAGIILAVIVVGGAFWLYGQLGAPHELRLYDLQQEWTEGPRIGEEELQELRQTAQRALQQRPHSTQLLSLLARVEMQTGRYRAAARYYERLAEEAPDNPDILAQWAQAQYMVEGQRMTPQIEELLDRALRRDPEQRTALGMRGMTAFTRGDYMQAIESWERLLEILPEQSQDRAMIANGLNHARERAVAEGLLNGLRVQVDLRDEWRGQLSGTLFVFALSDDGSRLPVAAIRLPLEQVSWPMEVTLTDQNAMMPERKLSDFDEVRVVARISRQGDVSARSGDVEGASEALLWEELEEPVQITIDRRIE